MDTTTPNQKMHDVMNQLHVLTARIHDAKVAFYANGSDHDAASRMLKILEGVCDVCDGSGITDGFGGNGVTTCHKCKPKIYTVTTSNDTERIRG